MEKCLKQPIRTQRLRVNSLSAGKRDWTSFGLACDWSRGGGREFSRPIMEWCVAEPMKSRLNFFMQKNVDVIFVVIFFLLPQVCGRVSAHVSSWSVLWRLCSGSSTIQWKCSSVFHVPHHLRSPRAWRRNDSWSSKLLKWKSFFCAWPKNVWMQLRIKTKVHVFNGENWLDKYTVIIEWTT